MSIIDECAPKRCFFRLKKLIIVTGRAWVKRAGLTHKCCENGQIELASGVRKTQRFI
jgi:hypothetical protein